MKIYNHGALVGLYVVHHSTTIGNWDHKDVMKFATGLII